MQNASEGWHGRKIVQLFDEALLTSFRRLRANRGALPSTQMSMSDNELGERKSAVYRMSG
jgi:hypothetical protein